MTASASSIATSLGGPSESVLDGTNSHLSSRTIEDSHMLHSDTFDYKPWVQLDLGTSKAVKTASLTNIHPTGCPLPTSLPYKVHKLGPCSFRNLVYDCLKLDLWLSRCSNRLQVYIILLLIVKAIIDVKQLLL